MMGPVSYIPGSMPEYLFISVVMYTVHASILLSRSRFAPFNSVGEGHSEMGTLKFFIPRMDSCLVVITILSYQGIPTHQLWIW